jgi:alpha-glucoside transport system substrate-binding protein
MKARLTVAFSVLMIAALLLSACGAPGAPATPATGGQTGSGSTAAENTPAGSGSTAAENTPAASGSTAAENTPAASGAQAAGADTGSILLLGAFGGGEADAFNKTLADFNAANPGIKAEYSSVNSFETVIQVRIQGRDLPDIAAYPQPGGVARAATQDKVLVPLWPEALAVYDKNFSPAWKELATVGGTTYGMFHRVNAKGMIWYNKPEWEKAGWSIPKTWDELMKLSQDMIAKGGAAPFCEGIGAAAATGWKGTDWIESLMLRTAPVETYDKWARGELKFTSPEVKRAFELLGQIWMDPQMVYGGSQTIATTDVPTAATWLFDSPPKCWMHFQGSFVTNFFQPEVRQKIDEQVGFFMLPPVDASIANPPLEVGGDMFVVFQGKDRPEVRKLIEWLGTPDAAKSWAQAGGALFPYKGQDMSWYPTKLEAQLMEQVVNPQSARFDASDQMPAKMNTAFWKGITDWVSGNRTLDQALQDIDTTSAQP